MLYLLNVSHWISLHVLCEFIKKEKQEIMFIPAIFLLIGFVLIIIYMSFLSKGQTGG